jgi:hypothetical protein
MAKGTEWKNVNTVSFTGEIKKLHKSYADANKAAKEHATRLRDALKTEWQNKHPLGDGNKQMAAFKVSNGSVQYAMVDAKEVNTGDDIFA